MEDKLKRTYMIGGLIFIGFIIIGFGCGMLFEKAEHGAVIGTGVGFVGMGMSWLKYV